MPTKNNETEEENYNDNNQDDSNNRSYNIKDNEQPGNVNWWLNELDSLGIKKNNGDINLASNNQNSSSSSSNKTKPVSSRQLEDLTDDIKQTFIRDYKACYNE
jgi:hypothetical protein